MLLSFVLPTTASAQTIFDEPGSAKRTAPAPPNPSPPPAPKASTSIELLPLIDPTKDVLFGDVKKADDELIFGVGGARVRIPFEPPAEYDFEVAFARRQYGHLGDIRLLCSRDRDRFMANTGAGGNRDCYFWGSGDPNEIKTTKYPFYVDNQVYVIRVEVRKDHVAEYVDNKLVARAAATHGHAVPRWVYVGEKMLGLSSENAMVFSSIKLTEVTGHGQVVERPAAIAQAPAPVPNNPLAPRAVLPRATPANPPVNPQADAPDWTADTLPPIRDFTDTVTAVNFLDHGNILLTGCYDKKGSVYRLDGRTAAPGFTFNHAFGIEGIKAYSGPGVQPGIYSVSRTIYNNWAGSLHWTSVDGKRARDFNANIGQGFRCIAIADPGVVAVGGGGGAVRVIDMTRDRNNAARGGRLESLEIKPAATPLPSSVTQMAFRFNRAINKSYQLIAGCGDGTIHLFIVDPTGVNESKVQFGKHDRGIWGLLVTADGNTLITGSNDHTIRFWNCESGQEIERRRIQTAGGVTSMALAPDATTLVTAQDDHHVRFYDSSSGKMTLELDCGLLPMRCVDVCAAADPRTWKLAAGGDDHEVHLWNVTPVGAARPAAGRLPRNR